MSEERNKTDNGQLEDRALIEDFQAGDKAVFDKLVLRYKDKVFNLCYRFLGEYEEADDSAQETFVKAYRSLKKFRFESSFSTWLYRVAVNTCKNRLTSLEYRQRKKMVRINNPGIQEESRGTIDIKDESLSPTIELEKKEKAALIQQAIDSLPKEQKEVIVLRDIEGLSYEEIIDITGYNPGTLKSKLSRARYGLRAKLKGVL